MQHSAIDMDNQYSHSLHVRPRAHDKYLRLIEAAKKLPPVTTAVAHPCDEVSLGGAIEARKLGLIEPLLVGPPARIRDVAARYGLDITNLPIIEFVAQPRSGSQGSCPGAGSQGRRTDEGQPAHR